MTSSKPSSHSFRHTFAVHRIKQWMKEGVLVDSKLKYLSLYMGHTDITHTQYYIHFVPELFPLFTETMKQAYRVLPEVLDESS